MKYLLPGLILPVIILFASCRTSKDMIYFPDLKDSLLESNTPLPESVIRSSDLLSISVSDLNPEAAAIFNPANTTANTEYSGYLVNTDGNIQFPMLGSVKAAGLTKVQLQNNLKESLKQKKYLLEPIVIIHFVNFRVTVLGEVARPTVINVPSEKISLLEALGLAGDLTIQARRDNVLIIREENNQRIVKRVNLNSSEIFTSPYYYLKSNDIIYAEPNKTKIASLKQTPQWIPIVLTGLSFAMSVATFLKN